MFKDNSLKISERFPSQGEIFHWIEELCRYPHRRTGTEESKRAVQYLREQFEAIGLRNIGIESTASVNFDAYDYYLHVEDKDISCFMINGTLHPEEIGSFDAGEVCCNTEIVYLGEGRTEDFAGVDVKGKIVLCDCPWFDTDEDTYAANWCETEGIVFDPDRDKRMKLRKTDSYSPNAWPYNYFSAQKNGAAGFVGVLNDYFSDGINWNEDYSELAVSQGCGSMSIPGLWIGIDAFDELKSLLTNDKAKASMGMKTQYKDGVASNVWGILPGMSDDVVLVHSHYDSVFTGAVQDASGMSEVLALAKYFAQVPIEERKKTIIFAGLDGHYTDYAGHKFFIRSRLEEGMNIVCDFVIEHIGKEVGIGEGNKPIVADEAEIRLLYVTDKDDMVDMAYSAISRNNIKRTVILPVSPGGKDCNDIYEFNQAEVISDAYYSNLNGIPVVSLLSPQMYLFHPMDKPGMVPQDELVPIGIAFAEMIHEVIS